MRSLQQRNDVRGRLKRLREAHEECARDGVFCEYHASVIARVYGENDVVRLRWKMVGSAGTVELVVIVDGLAEVDTLHTHIVAVITPKQPEIDLGYYASALCRHWMRAGGDPEAVWDHLARLYHASFGFPL